MSNPQDVSLTKPEVLPLADSQQSHVSRTSLIKRFFKVSKKPLVLDLTENASETSSDEDNKKLRKSNTLSRVFSRKNKGSNRDGSEQSTSMGNQISQDMPLVNSKPGLKSSMSVYWKRLFHRQKSQSRAASSEQERSANIGPEEQVHEVQLVQIVPEIQVQPPSELEVSHLDENQEPQPQIVPVAEPLTPKKPKKSSPIPGNMSGENLSPLEHSHRPVTAAEPEDEPQAPEYAALNP